MRLQLGCRNDAALAAAELCLGVEKLALEVGGRDTVATCGRWQVEPNAVNSVPRVASLGIDLRDTDLSRRDRILDSILSLADDVAGRRSVGLRICMVVDSCAALQM